MTFLLKDAMASLLKKITNFLFVIAFLLLAACAGELPLPGGDERINESLYDSNDDLLGKLGLLERGMTYGEVFEILGHPGNDLIILSRAEIIQELFGSSDMQINDSLEDMDNGTSFLQTLYGYRFNYRVVDREHGLSSPIRLQTDEKGYSYSVSLIFRGGKLFEKPIVSGGVVDGSKSTTIFDYLSPSSFVNSALE